MPKITTYHNELVGKDHYECDGPQHEPPDEIEFAMELSHGYGSQYDGSVQYFCNMKCLSDWVNNPPEPSTVKGIYNDY